MTNFPELRAAIRAGSSYPLIHRLAYYASEFAPTAPLNQAVTLGFYDTLDNMVSIPSVLDIGCTHSPTFTVQVAQEDAPDVALPVGVNKPRRLSRRTSSLRVIFPRPLASDVITH